MASDGAKKAPHADVDAESSEREETALETISKVGAIMADHTRFLLAQPRRPEARSVSTLAPKLQSTDVLPTARRTYSDSTISSRKSSIVDIPPTHDRKSSSAIVMSDRRLPAWPYTAWK
jgi:hypothetical protein